MYVGLKVLYIMNTFTIILVIAGCIFLLAVLAYSFFQLAKNGVSAIRERNYRWLIQVLAVTVIFIALCLFLIKPDGIVEKLVQSVRELPL